SAAPPPGRSQQIDAGQAFRVLIDYAHTVNAFRSLLSALRDLLGEGGRLIAVFGAAGNRDRGKRPVLAEIAMKYTDYFYVTNEDPCDEDPHQIMAEILSGVPSEDAGRRFELQPDRETAIRLACQRAGASDTVVILGKGHERSIVAGGRKLPWSDEDVTRRILSAL
ncbi:MAG: glutamate ligase domain-containing protein, partial [Chloroflexota bacterium]